VSYGAKKHDNMQSFGASIGICYFVRQQGHTEPGSLKRPYPPFAGVDEDELLTAEPVEPWLSPPHALNVVATIRASAVTCNALTKHDSKPFMANSSNRRN
jgi:hypothetical protein